MEARASVCGSLRRMGGAAEAKGGGALVNADEIAADQGLQRGGRQVLDAIGVAEFGERQFAVAGGQFGEDGLLLCGQRGQAGFRDEDGEALSAAGIALGGGGFAGNPLFAQQAGE